MIYSNHRDEKVSQIFWGDSIKVLRLGPVCQHPQVYFSLNRSFLVLYLSYYNMILSLFAAALLAPSVIAFWRLPCAKPVLNARVDPIIDPGGPSGHLHTIMGSNGKRAARVTKEKSHADLMLLAIGYSTTFGDLRSCQCSTCQVKDDKSAYWIPQLVRSNLAHK
jgi:Domain of unknown function (DUF1996)